MKRIESLISSRNLTYNFIFWISLTYSAQ